MKQHFTNLKQNIQGQELVWKHIKEKQSGCKHSQQMRDSQFEGLETLYKNEGQGLCHTRLSL